MEIELLKSLKELREHVSSDVDATKRWIWDAKEVRALDLVITTLEDCVG